ncbi:hypothetical protein, partial [Bradyrhizobium canariense]
MILGKIDGKRIVFGGDNLFLYNPEAGEIDRDIAIQSTVMRNSFQLDMHRRCVNVIRSIKPELVCPGHGELIAMSPSRIAEYTDYIERKEIAFREAVDEPADHFIDLFWVRMVPYLSEVRPNSEVTYVIKIRNNLERTAVFTARLLPAFGWTAQRAVQSISL